MHETKPPTSGLTITCNINPSLSLSESFRSTPNQSDATFTFGAVTVYQQPPPFSFPYRHSPLHRLLYS